MTGLRSGEERPNIPTNLKLAFFYPTDKWKTNRIRYPKKSIFNDTKKTYDEHTLQSAALLRPNWLRDEQNDGPTGGLYLYTILLSSLGIVLTYMFSVELRYLLE